MQQILPIFPDDIKMVNYQVGFKKMDDFVHYFVNGMPVYCHKQDDKGGYRFVLASLVNNKFWLSVTVRIEPLQQASRRTAQKQLCRKLTSLGVQTPTGKFMIIEVGDSPI